MSRDELSMLHREPAQMHQLPCKHLLDSAILQQQQEEEEEEG